MQVPSVASNPRFRERGNVSVMFTVLLACLLGCAAFVIDGGNVSLERRLMQNAADAAALAAAQDLGDASSARAMAEFFAERNHPGKGLAGDAVTMEIGTWDPSSRVFDPGAEPPDAVRVTVSRSAHTGNAVPLILGSMFGLSTVDVTASAIATGRTSRPETRFLIDDEVFDTDVPAIQSLAAHLGKSPDQLLSDADGDWFIDIPPGSVLDLPTGQVGDEGLFDIDHAAFPFDTDTHPSFTDFLNYNEDSSSWRYDLVAKSMLDPLLGVKRVSDSVSYSSYVSSSCNHVSPVYKSDISALNAVRGEPAVNALGLRRGLVTFKILGVGTDPDGSGSMLPNLIIEVCDPDDIDLGEVGPPGGATGDPRLVE